MSSANQHEFVQGQLRRYRDLTMDRLMSLFPTEQNSYLYDLLPSYPARPGKGLRSALCVATCKAFGGSEEHALNTATAIELFHNAFLIHDDIQDRSEFRRGSPALHTEHGIGVAINVGNAMNLSSLHQLMENRQIFGPQLTWRIFAETEQMLRHTLDGQVLEIAWIRDNICDLSDKDYFRLCLKKTSWYTCIYPCRVGALIAHSALAHPDQFNRFGAYLGAAFQMQDDLLNVDGEYENYGKEIRGDIWEGKRTLILIHLLNACDVDERSRLEKILANTRQQRSADDVNWIYRLMKRYGSIESVRLSARQLARAALKEFTVAFGDAPASEDKRFILEVIQYMIERER